MAGEVLQGLDDDSSDDAVAAWYGARGAIWSSVVSCPVCHAAVANNIKPQRDHMQWHRSRGE